MGKRLNDTAAVQAIPAMPSNKSGSHSSALYSDTRAIDNGFVTRKSGHVNGSWQESERFHETPEPPGHEDSRGCCGDRGGALSRAASYLRDK